MRKYHLSCGNSTQGPVGICGTVLAPDKRHALLLFRRAFKDATGAFGEVPLDGKQTGIEYINVYIAPANIQIEDITSESS